MTDGAEGSGGGRRGRVAAAARATSPPATPVIALRMEGLLVWVAELVAKLPREHKLTAGGEANAALRRAASS